MGLRTEDTGGSSQALDTDASFTRQGAQPLGMCCTVPAPEAFAAQGCLTNTSNRWLDPNPLGTTSFGAALAAGQGVIGYVTGRDG